MVKARNIRFIQPLKHPPRNHVSRLSESTPNEEEMTAASTDLMDNQA
jgi:hypothetical protein